MGYERDADGHLVPCPGKLYYRGYELDDLVSPILKEKRFGFEEIVYLLLSGKLPDTEELAAFRELLNDNMPLDHRTIVNIIDLEGNNIMNILARCVLEMGFSIRAIIIHLRKSDCIFCTRIIQGTEKGLSLMVE